MIRSISTILYFIILFMTSDSYASVPSNIIKLSDSVVTVMLVKDGTPIATGSGFSVKPTGYIVTNYHVIEGYFKAPNISITVKLGDGTLANVSNIINFDEKHDIAKLKLSEIQIPQMSMSNIEPNQGDDIFVIGSPMGLETTISTGIISSIRGEDKFVQITAPISAGSSGSPVINSHGEVIGIATLILLGGQNLNFAIPITYLNQLNSKKDINIKLNNNQSNGNSDSNNNHEYRKDIHQFKQAKVDLVMDVKNNTYIRYISDNVKYWLCAPSSDVKIGDIVEFPITVNNKNHSDEVSDMYFENICYIPSFTIISKRKNEPSVEEELFIADNYRDANICRYALPLYNKILALDHNHSAYYGRSKCHENDIEWQKPDKNISACEESLADINKAISMYSDSEYYAHRAGLYNNNESCPNISNLELALADYTTAIKIKPTMSYYNLRATLLLNSKEYVKALDDVNKSILISIESTNMEIRGDILNAMDDYSKAIQDYKKAIDISYKSNNIFDKLFAPTEKIKLVYKNNKNFKDGITYFSSLIHKHPNESSLYACRAELYFEDKQLNKSISDYTTAITFSPKYMQCYENRADIYIQTDNYNQAYYDYKKACELANDETSAQCYMKDYLTDLKKRGFNWVDIAKSSTTTFYYDKNLKKNIGKNIFKVWFRTEETDLSKYKESMSFTGLDYKNYAYSMSEWQIDCNINKFSSVQYIDYDDNGSIISSSTYKINYNSPIPETIADTIVNSICSTVIMNKNKLTKKLKHKSKL